MLPKQHMGRGWGPLRGAMSVQKALQESKTETGKLLGGTEENNVLPHGWSLTCLPGKVMISLLKANWKQLCKWPDLEAWLLLCQTKFLLNSLDHLEKRPVLGCCAGRGWGWLPPSGGKGGFSLTLWAVNTGGGGTVAIIIFSCSRLTPRTFW